MSCVKIPLRNDLEVSGVEFRSDACAFSIPSLPEPAAIVLAEMLRGPPGPIGGYTHVQSSASAAWTINHNLGVRPTISLYSVGGAAFEGQITHINDSQAVVNLATAVAGFARCS